MQRRTVARWPSYYRPSCTSWTLPETSRYGVSLGFATREGRTPGNPMVKSQNIGQFCRILEVMTTILIKTHPSEIWCFPDRIWGTLKLLKWLVNFHEEPMVLGCPIYRDRGYIIIYIYIWYIYTYMYIHIYVYMPSHRIEPTYGIWWGSPTKYMIWDLIYDVWCISMYFNNVYHQMCPGGIRDLPWCGWNFVAWCPICQNIFVFICMGRLISINTRCCDVKHWTVFLFIAMLLSC